MTELSREHPGEHLHVRSVSGDAIRVGDEWYAGSLIISAERVLEDWAPEVFEDLQQEHFEPLLELKPEVVLLGTGASQSFPEPALLAQFYAAGVGVEVMSTRAACRTFNVLVGEGRKVIAALLPLSAG